MSQLTPNVASIITNGILKQMTCAGNNVYSQVQQQKYEEEISLQHWRQVAIIYVY